MHVFFFKNAGQIHCWKFVCGFICVCLCTPLCVPAHKQIKNFILFIFIVVCIYIYCSLVLEKCRLFLRNRSNFHNCQNQSFCIISCSKILTFVSSAVVTRVWFASDVDVMCDFARLCLCAYRKVRRKCCAGVASSL